MIVHDWRGNPWIRLMGMNRSENMTTFYWLVYTSSVACTDQQPNRPPAGFW